MRSASPTTTASACCRASWAGASHGARPGQRAGHGGENIGQVINVAGVGGVAGDSDQVGRGVEIDGLVVFIDQCDPVGPATKPAR